MSQCQYSSIARSGKVIVGYIAVEGLTWPQARGIHTPNSCRTRQPLCELKGDPQKINKSASLLMHKNNYYIYIKYIINIINNDETIKR